jgi:hypothetical protein
LQAQVVAFVGYQIAVAVVALAVAVGVADAVVAAPQVPPNTPSTGHKWAR